MKDNQNIGKIYLIPTPIGNLEDITFRAVRILKKVSIILTEDTRVSSKLLNYYDISTPTLSFHAFNEHKRVEKILGMLFSGKIIAQISDSGTPSISDPGYLLIKHAIQNNIKIEILPGATAIIPALLQSGFSSDRFIFEGFLPRKKGKKSRIKELQEEYRTTIFYESPHRLLKTLEQLYCILGNRQVAVSKELTKKFENTIRGSLSNVIEIIQSKPIKGEFVIALEGKK